MKLYVLERKNGWYGGYYEEDGELVQAFNTSAAMLFGDIKWWYEKGYTDLVFIDSNANFIQCILEHLAGNILGA